MVLPVGLPEYLAPPPFSLSAASDGITRFWTLTRDEAPRLSKAEPLMKKSVVALVERHKPVSRNGAATQRKA